MPRPARFAACCITGLLLAAVPASAQTIGGMVTDATGGVLPGVTVEARSPALIEQVRTAVTDASGQYRIVALEPGVYAVTFSLAGFSTLLREGIALTTGFTANVDAEMAVGALEETVTVTESSPVIDVQSIEQSQSIGRDVFEALPTARQFDSLALLIPAMNIQGGPSTSLSIDTAGISGEGRNRLSIHGSNETDGEIQLDGMDISSPSFNGSPHQTPFDTSIAEFVYDYSGNSAEVETGAVRLNMIPKEGSNVFSGGFHFDFTHSSWLANNVGQGLIDRGITGGREGGTRLDEAWYVAPSIGGPIVRDHLWFFATYSYRRGSIFPANLFNDTDTSDLRYVPDLSRPQTNRKNISEGTQRLTWQATAKDKIQTYSNLPRNVRYIVPMLTGADLEPLYISPEAGNQNEASVNTYQVAWVRPQTNRILFEAGVGHQPVGNAFLPLDAETAAREGSADLGARIDLPGLFEVTTLTMARNMGFIFQGTDFHLSTTNTTMRASMSYVTGSHNLKVGTQVSQKAEHALYRSGNNWTDVLTAGGAPVQARFHARPSRHGQLTNVGVYAQEQWTLDRLTVNAGLRFDWYKGFYPDQVAEPMTWAPEPRPFPGDTVVNWKDLQPRLGVVYDLRGDGRTAIKASASRYGQLNDIAFINNLNPVAQNTVTSRLWLDGRTGCVPGYVNPFPGDPAYDACVPGDGLVQGDPLNPRPNGELLSPSTTPAFATPARTVFFDEDWAFGWGKKGGNWEYSASVQHEVGGGVSVDAGYFRRHYFNFSAADDRAVGAGDWDRYAVTVPADPRLPADLHGAQLTLVDLNPAAVAQPDNLTGAADDFGGRLRTWRGLDLNFTARFDDGMLQGGYATGKERNDQCALQEALPELINASPGSGQSAVPVEFCDTETPWISQLSVFGSYTLPYDVELSGAFFSRQGTPRLAVYNVPQSAAAAALGRPPTETSINVNLLEPGTAYGDRVNQLDLRIGKILRFGGGPGGGPPDLRASFEIYNLFNANAVSRERSGLSGAYLQPIGLQPGRLFKVAFQFNY